MKESNPKPQDTQNEDDEDIDIMCNSSCNLHYHVKKHATSVLEWFKKLFKKLLLLL